MPNGKPAGVPCIHLDNQFNCLLFNQSTRPAICRQLKPCPEMCGANQQEALAYLTLLEQLTSN